MPVVRHLEVGFAVHLHAALAREERGGILHAARRIEPDLRAVGQHGLRAFAEFGIDDNRTSQPLDGGPGHPAAGQQHDDHGCGSRHTLQTADPPHPPGPFAEPRAAKPVGLIHVDAGRIVDAVVEIEQPIDLAQPPTVGRRGIVPGLHRGALFRVEFTAQISGQRRFVDFKIRHFHLLVCIVIQSAGKSY